MQPLASQLGSHVAYDDVAAFNNFASEREAESDGD